MATYILYTAFLGLSRLFSKFSEKVGALVRGRRCGCEVGTAERKNFLPVAWSGYGACMAGGEGRLGDKFGRPQRYQEEFAASDTKWVCG